MSDLASAPFRAAAPTNGTRPRAARPVLRRRSLPGGRAVVGGLLVAASAVGLFAAYRAAEGGPIERYVTLATEVNPGHVLVPSDLALVPIDLPAAQRGVAFTDPRLLIGKVAVARMKNGQLLQSADVSRVRGDGRRADISVGVEPGNAMNGSSDYLRGGERVDVIATFTEGGTALTRTVARDALVVEVLAGDRNLGNDGRLTVVLSVPRDDLEPIAGAAAVGKITLARTTGLER
jgi:Flp pilus assembly protein CpaB